VDGVRDAACGEAAYPKLSNSARNSSPRVPQEYMIFQDGRKRAPDDEWVDGAL
jgi:hypothetical protein